MFTLNFSSRKVEEKPMVFITCNSRGKRKYVTTIVGLTAFGEARDLIHYFKLGVQHVTQ